jgi:hypothetical protein
MGHLEALLIHLPTQVMNGAISKTKRAKISSQYMKECKPRMSKSRVPFAVH